jgi:hypothetical protein
MRILGFVLSGLVVLCFAQAPAAAADLDVSIRFSSNEISVIHDYFRSHRVDRKGGKKDSKPLPPGIVKNLGRGKPLPPGIAKRAFPGALVAQLPPAPHGYERVIIAGKILLVEIATQVVHDILVDVLID